MTDEGTAKAPPLPFEKQYRLGLLPTTHRTRTGEVIPWLDMPDKLLNQIYYAFLNKGYRTPVYMAVARERARRQLGVPAPETHPPARPALICPECGAEMWLRDSKYGLFYGCSTFPKCKATHGAHPDGQPLGTPATPEVKQARIRAHAAFDRLWEEQPRRMKRKEAYRWMQTALGLSSEEAHIGKFDLAQCVKLIEAVTKYLTENP